MAAGEREDTSEGAAPHELSRALLTTTRLDDTPPAALLGDSTTISDTPASRGVPTPPETGRAGAAAILGEEDASGGRYELRDTLGSGGGGQVYLVYDRHFDRELALKAIHPEHAGSAERMASFVREARVTAKLEHPSILPVHDLDVDRSGRLYFTMRRASGRSLAELIDRAEHGDVPERIAELSDRVDILVKVCEAAAYAHSRGIVHQDIKPANILLGEYGEVLLCDWGTAMDSGAAMGRRRLMGTPAYMAPEQARREGADVRSDVYCLGATLFHLLFFRLPTLATTAEDFWAAKRSGAIDPLPDTARRRVPAYLVDLVFRALDPDPARRFQDALALRDALRAFQRNQDSLRLCERAEQQLAALADDASYQDLGRVRDQFQTAVDLWSANERAAHGCRRASMAYAEAALRRGDLDLADDLCPRDEDALRARIAQARIGRRRERLRARRLRTLALVLAALVGAAAVWIGVEQARRVGEWRIVLDRELTARAAALDGLVTTKHQMRDGAPVAAPVATLEEEGLLLQPLHLLWLPVEVAGDVRATVDVTWPERIDGLEILLHARREDPPLWWQMPVSYSCQIGGYGGSIDYIAINRVAGAANTSHATATDLVPGRRYRIVFELDDDWLAIRIDGRTVLRRQVSLPVAGSGDVGVALRCWSDPVLLHRLQVERQALPLRATPLVSGDAFIADGQTERAYRQYLALARDFAGTAVAEEALGKACVAVSLLDDGAARADEIRRRLRGEFPSSRFGVLCDEATALARWREGAIDDALALVSDIQRRAPETRIALSLLDEQRPFRLAEGQGRRLLEAIAATQGLGRLKLDDLGLRDLGPLRGMQLRLLSLAHNEIDDLAPLRGMQLVELTVQDNLVHDLGPLAGMPLRTLDIDGNRVADLSPLAGMEIEHLEASHNPLSDLGPLRGMPLTRLELQQTQIVDLAPVATLERLEILHLRGTGIADVSSLRGLQRLRQLYIDGTAVADVAPLAGLPLEVLALSGSEVSDLAPLARLPLRELRAERLPALDLQPLASLPLQSCILNRTAIADVSPLMRCTTLRTLDLEGCGIRSFPPLALPALTSLRLQRNQLQRVPELGGAPALRALFLEGNPLTDLSTLADSRLHFVDITGHRCQDLEILEDMEVAGGCRLRGPLLEQGALARLGEAWRRRGRPDEILRCVAVQDARQSGDLLALRRLALRHGESHFVYTWERLPASEARALAARFEARLPVIKDAGTQRVLMREASADVGGFWLGLRSRDDRPVWSDGSEATFLPIVPGDGGRSASGGDWVLHLGALNGVWEAVGGDSGVILEWPLDASR